MIKSPSQEEKAYNVLVYLKENNQEYKTITLADEREENEAKILLEFLIQKGYASKIFRTPEGWNIHHPYKEEAYRITSEGLYFLQSNTDAKKIPMGKLAALINIYRESVRNVPLLKYSWIIIAAIVLLALTAYFKLKNSDVFFYAICVIVVSFFGFLFSYFLRTKDTFIKYSIRILIICIVITSTIAILSFGAFIIWEKPTFYERWFPDQSNKLKNLSPFEYTLYFETEKSLSLSPEYPSVSNDSAFLILDNDPKGEIITNKMEANYKNIPFNFRNQKIKLKIKSPFWKAIHDSILLVNKATTISIAPSGILQNIFGKVKNIKNGEPIPDALVEIEGFTKKTDSLGHFSFSIPIEKQKIKYLVTVYKSKFERWAKYINPLESNPAPVNLISIK